jgi:hypothetical protein
MKKQSRFGLRICLLSLLVFALLRGCSASLGDRLPEFRECVKVRSIAEHSDIDDSDTARYVLRRIASRDTLLCVSSVVTIIEEW